MLPMTVQPHYRLGSLEEALLGAKSILADVACEELVATVGMIMLTVV